MKESNKSMYLPPFVIYIPYYVGHREDGALGIFHLFLNENECYDPSLELPR